MHHLDHIKDGGYKSRKMVMAYVVMLIGSVAWAFTARYPALAASLSELYMFLLGAASLFISGNVAVKWMGSKTTPLGGMVQQMTQVTSGGSEPKPPAQT